MQVPATKPIFLITNCIIYQKFLYFVHIKIDTMEKIFVACYFKI